MNGRHAFEGARKEQEAELGGRHRADRLPSRERDTARRDAEERDHQAPPQHRVRERPECLVEPERRLPDAVEEAGEPGQDETAARERDRTGHREREGRQDERVAEPAAQICGVKAR